MQALHFGDALGPLAGTLPHAAAVLACLIAMLLAARIAASAIRDGRAFLLLGSWGCAMAAFVAMAVAFQAFAWGTAPSFAVAARFIGAYGVPLAAVLLLGAVTAAIIELLRPSARFGAEREARERRAAMVGSLGEALVRAELQKLGWPSLSNVVLVRRWGSAEIDHLVRAPDGIVVIETKTLSGLVSGFPEAPGWSQQVRGEVRGFQNPLMQNVAHLDAARETIGDSAVSLRGLVVSAGKARFAEPLAGCVVPVRDLAAVLRDGVAMPLFGQAAIDLAWAALVAQAARSELRRAAHIAYARSRKRVRPVWR